MCLEGKLSFKHIEVRKKKNKYSNTRIQEAQIVNYWRRQFYDQFHSKKIPSALKWTEMCEFTKAGLQKEFLNDCYTNRSEVGIILYIILTSTYRSAGLQRNFLLWRQRNPRRGFWLVQQAPFLIPKIQNAMNLLIKYEGKKLPLKIG